MWDQVFEGHLEGIVGSGKFSDRSSGEFSLCAAFFFG